MDDTRLPGPRGRGHAAAANLAAMAIFILTAGCGIEKPPPPAEPIVFEGKPLEVGEKALFEFPADGEWHTSPHLAYNNQRIKIVPTGTGLQIPSRAIEFRVGRMNQIVSDRSEFTVTEPGPIAFRLNPRRTAGFQGNVQVQIERLPGTK